MAAPPRITQLVERFKDNLDAYKRGKYKEAQLRREFIDPFFGELGWDVQNTQGYAEAYKDVIHEDTIKIGGYTKAPDYCFRIGGVRKFFLEAKRPSTDVKDEISPAYQLRRYAWSAKLPLSILSDFEEFAIYDCRVKPGKKDKASTARTIYMTFDEYADRWEEITGVFSREAILKGSFDKYVQSTRLKRGTAEVDNAFLEEIERWRTILARNIALRNPGLSQRELNFAVQRTIDRIIFLRICEDRGIESYGELMALQNGPRAYRRLFELFRKADDRYNSGLFHFRSERERPSESLDALTSDIKVDDKILRDVIKNLYYPDSPYEFSVLPADILGQVYERFLGSVIRLTPGHRAVVEEKPEVRKAGGVYYTPTYIVDYIVKNTVGNLVKGKKPGPRGAVSKLRILDPACGSGSFLLGAYQYLLDWHRDEYSKKSPEKWAKGRTPRLYQGSGGEWKLTTNERKRILLNNIYGVDIDSQAVEVTKLSLLLKVLEGENQETIESQLRLFQERALPDLSNNIKCGNSLIGPDFYEGKQMSLLDDEELQRINAFDWNAEFVGIMRAGGFDAVIGNPPYGFHQIHQKQIKPYYSQNYVSSHGSFEHYFLFYERSLGLLAKRGYHGFIVPVTWLTIPSADALRRFILSEYWIQEICWFPDPVFEQAQVNTVVSIMRRSSMGDVRVTTWESTGPARLPVLKRTCSQKHFIDLGYYIAIFEDRTDTALLTKIQRLSVPLSTLAKPCSGYNPYEVGKGERPEGGTHDKNTISAKPYHSDVKMGGEWKPEVVGRDIHRYSVHFSGQRWIKYGPWLAAPREPDNFRGQRILVQEITGGKDRRISAGYTEEELYHSRDIIPIKIERAFPSPLYLLSIINSKLISWFHLKRNPKAQKSLFPKVLVSDLKRLPIRPVNPDCRSDVNRHECMVEAAELMLNLHERYGRAKPAGAKTALRRRIGALDQRIDALVYDLYELAPKDRRIVEDRLPGRGED